MSDFSILPNVVLSSLGVPALLVHAAPESIQPAAESVGVAAVPVFTPIAPVFAPAALAVAPAAPAVGAGYRVLDLPRFFDALGNPLRWQMVRMLVAGGAMSASMCRRRWGGILMG